MTKESWKTHILENHALSRYWECPACKHPDDVRKFSSAESFIKHTQVHGYPMPGKEIDQFAELCLKTELPSIGVCPLCKPPNDVSSSNLEAALDHLGKHIHDFSLLSLPWAKNSVQPSANISKSKIKFIEAWRSVAELSGTTTDTKVSARFLPTIAERSGSPVSDDTIIDSEDCFAKIKFVEIWLSLMDLSETETETDAEVSAQFLHLTAEELDPSASDDTGIDPEDYFAGESDQNGSNLALRESHSGSRSDSADGWFLDVDDERFQQEASSMGNFDQKELPDLENQKENMFGLQLVDENIGTEATSHSVNPIYEKLFSPLIMNIAQVPAQQIHNIPGTEKYLVGWICAISTEAVAATLFLDEEHPPLAATSKNDNNTYQLGKIGPHNVVVAVLPEGEYGTVSASAVVRDMLHTFQNIRVVLMVGIGGGAPTRKDDIRLGDIVVSSPGNGYPGVFQYDYGKAIQNREFQTTRQLDQPPTAVRTAVQALKTTHEIHGHYFNETIGSILGKCRPKIRKKYSRPTAEDRLYQPGYVHRADPEAQAHCVDVCGEDPTNLVQRRERDEDDDNPAIHHGLIASANTLMKDAETRDHLSGRHRVLCFEMEAAGLINHFPCLVIRGICDYSDTHKNREWQGFAAMTAAAYAKDLLLKISPTNVENESRLKDLITSGE